MGSRDSSLQRRCGRKLQVQEEISLILIWEKTGGQSAAKQTRKYSTYNEHEERNNALSNQSARNSNVTVRCSGEGSIEPVKKYAKQSGALCSWSQQQGRQCRT